MNYTKEQYIEFAQTFTGDQKVNNELIRAINRNDRGALFLLNAKMSQK